VINEPEVKTLSRRLVCENTKFNVFFDHVLDQNGFEVPNYLVVSPKQQTQYLVSGVAILPIIDGKVGLVKIFRPAIGTYGWEIPHGFVEASESSRDGALRELVEETGIKAVGIKSLGYITPDAGVLAARVELFVAEPCKLAHDADLEFGLAELKLFSLNEFEAMIRSSQIQDTFTLSAWCKYQLSLTNRSRDRKEF